MTMNVKNSFHSISKCILIISVLHIGNLSDAQISKKEISFKENQTTKFNGTWEIVDMDMNIKLKKNPKAIPPKIFQKDEYIGKTFHVNRTNEVITYKGLKKILLTSKIEMFDVKRNTFIMRGMTGGYINTIKNKSAKESVLIMSRPVFFLFITNLNIRRENYQNSKDYEDASGNFYQQLLDKYTTIGDPSIQFHLLKKD